MFITSQKEKTNIWIENEVKNCCCTVTQLCLTLCDYSTPGFPVFHQLLELAQTHVHWVGHAISSSIVPSSCLQSFPASGSFPVSRLCISGDHSIGASASASVLLMSIQGWSLLGLACLISLQSKGLSRVFSNTTVWKHQFFSSQHSYGLTLTSIYDYWKNHSFVGKVMSAF